MTRISHIGIAVEDIEQAASIYDVLGVCVSHVETLDEQGVKVAFLCIGETEIELLQPVRDDGPVAKFIAKRGEGIHHMCIQVEDIAASMKELAERGAQLLSDAPVKGAAGTLVAFVHPRSASGVLLELSQPDPDAGEV